MIIARRTGRIHGCISCRNDFCSRQHCPICSPCNERPSPAEIKRRLQRHGSLLEWEEVGKWQKAIRLKVGRGDGDWSEFYVALSDHVSGLHLGDALTVGGEHIFFADGTHQPKIRRPFF